MPVYVCFRGDCDNLAFEEGDAAQVFHVTDALGRGWLCVETDRAEVESDAISDSTLAMMKAQGLLHRLGLSFAGSSKATFRAPDRFAASWHLIQASHPPRGKSEARMEGAGVAAWGFTSGTRRPYTLTIIATSGPFAFYGDSENEVWHRAAERLCGPTPGNEKPTMLTLTFEPKAAPLYRDADGVIRVGDTRIVLDAILALHLGGESPEAIAAAYPRVPLADVYTILAFYLHNKAAVDEYLKARESEADRLRQEIESAQIPTPGEFWSETRRRWAEWGRTHVASDR